MLAGLALGFGLGFAVGAQVGPITLLCIRSVLRGTFGVGVAIGAGAAVVDTLYGALGIAGASRLLEVSALRIGLGVTGAVVLGLLGLRTIWSAFRIRLGAETEGEVASPLRAFVTSLGATASNHLTIASWAAIFSAASTADVVTSTPAAAAMLAGIGAGTLTWFTILSGGLAIARRRVGTRFLRFVDFAAGGALVAFAAVLGYRALEGESAP